MADWRDELRTAAQKEHYIRTYVGVSAPKKSQEYRTAYQRLRLMVKKNQNPRKEEYKAVRNVAEFNASVRKNTPDEVLEESGWTGDTVDFAEEMRDQNEPRGGVEEGDVLFGDMVFRISKETIRRKGTIVVTEISAGMSEESAWMTEYWETPIDGMTVPYVWIQTITCYKI